MAVREIDPHWQSVHRALLNRIEYRERELLALHEDYICLEQRCAGLMAVIRRQARRDRLDRANAESKASNDG